MASQGIDAPLGAVSCSQSPALQVHADGITTVDCQYIRPQFAAMHVLQRGGEVCLVDCGTNRSVPLILSALAELELDPQSVRYLFLTHIHLDHAGGAGELVRHLPHAQVVAHPRAVRHLVDPTALAEASAHVYGQGAFDEMYGRLLPIEASRIVSTSDGQSVTLGSSRLGIVHTPGHALHHQILHDPQGAAVFTGDTFGLSYRHLDTPKGPFILPTTTPTQFDPEQLLTSVQRIVELAPKAAFLTHFGRVTGIVTLAAKLREEIEWLVQVARQCQAQPERQRRLEEAMSRRLQERLAAHGLDADEAQVARWLGEDIRLNAQGLVSWLERLERAK